MLITLMRLVPRLMLWRLEKSVGIATGSSKTPAERLDTIGSTLDTKYAEVCTRLEKFVKPLDPKRSYVERVQRLCTGKAVYSKLTEMHELLYSIDDGDLPAALLEYYEPEEHTDLIEDVDLLEKSVFQLDYLRGMLVPPQVHDAWPVP